MRIRLRFLTLVAISVAAVFYSSMPEGAADSKPSVKSVTFKDFATIFFKNCAGCHRPNDYEVVYPDGRRETLLYVDRYSFKWQTLYKLKAPLSIPKGSRLIVTAHFDNSARNKYNPDPTKMVRFGEPTYDEMLVGLLNYAVEIPKDRSSAVTAK